MPAVTRELSIIYGSTTVGGSTDRLIDGYVSLSKSFTNASVEFDLVISAATASAFATEVAAMETAFRDPFQDLEVRLGSETLLSLKPSANTGLNTMPSISKASDPRDTGRSRKYSIRIECELPADNSPTVGLRESTINVAFTPARKRRVSISGVVTAVSATGARAQYTALIAGYTAGILSGFGGTFELAEEPTTTSDMEDATISFTRIFDEVIFAEVDSVANPNIVRQSISIAKSQVGPGDTTGSGAVRLVNLSANYEAWIDKDNTQELASEWDSIKTWLYDEIRKVFDSGTIAVMDVAPRYDFAENKISATISAIGSDGSQLIEHRETVSTSDMFGVVLVPAWTGNPMSKYRYQGPSTVRRTTTVVQRVLSSSAGGGGGGASKFGIGGNLAFGAGIGGQFKMNRPGKGSFNFGIGGPAAQMGGGGIGMFAQRPGGGGGGGEEDPGGGGGGGMEWVGVSLQESETPLELGTDDQVINVIDKQSTYVEEAYESVGSGGSGGGGKVSPAIVPGMPPQ